MQNALEIDMILIFAVATKVLQTCPETKRIVRVIHLYNEGKAEC